MNKTFTETGIERTESMESVIDYSDDDFETRESDVLESDSSSKEVFKSIRTRYLSRVHSVSDPPLHSSIVDQAFFKSNSSPKNDDEFKFDIDNLTVDKTIDEESQKALSPDDFQIKVLAEAVLHPFGDKQLKRQDAVDLVNDKITKQDAFERHDSPELTDDLIDLNDNPKSKSESTFVQRSKHRNIFSRELSGIYKGKIKAFSMENINSNKEYKNALQEATSIEFICANNYSDMSLFNNNYSEMSLFTEGSDSVFLSPIEKNNNDVGATSKNHSEANNINENLTKDSTEPKPKMHNDVPIVKAESLLPFPYPDDIRPDYKIDMIQPLNAQLQCFPDDKVKKDLEKVNEELKSTFEAAIERIKGNTQINRQISMQTPKALKECLGFEESTKELKSSDNSKTFACILDEINIKCEFSEKNRESSPIKIVLDNSRNNNPEIVIEQVFETKPDSSKSNETLSPSTAPVIIESKNPFFDATMEEENRHTESKSPPVVDDVSYHLKINNRDLCDSEAILTIQNNNPDLNVPKPARRLTTFMTPMKIVGGNIDLTSPVIISPVLIQPVLFKPFATTSELLQPKLEIIPLESTSVQPLTSLETADENDKKSTIYYDDTAQVAGGKYKRHSNTIENIKSDDSTKRKGIYQKNTKAKPLLLLPWNAGSDTELQPTTLTKSVDKQPADSTSPGVKKLSRTPEWLIDNQYYQPLENVPFVINTVQTFTTPKIVDNKIKDNITFTNTNPFRSITLRRQSEENVYEEIGEPIRPALPDRNIADDEKISNKKLSVSEEFASITREEILKVPRKPKKPKKETHGKTQEDSRETARITKTVISLSRTPSANSEKRSSDISNIVQNIEKSSLIPARKLSLQTPKPQPALAKNTSSLPREKPYWKTLEHKRLSHPIRSLNDPPRYLRKSGVCVTSE